MFMSINVILCILLRLCLCVVPYISLLAHSLYIIQYKRKFYFTISKGYSLLNINIGIKIITWPSVTDTKRKRISYFHDMISWESFIFFPPYVWKTVLIQTTRAQSLYIVPIYSSTPAQVSILRFNMLVLDGDLSRSLS